MTDLISECSDLSGQNSLQAALQSILLQDANAKKLYDKFQCKCSDETCYYLLLSSNASHFFSEALRICNKQNSYIDSTNYSDDDTNNDNSADDSIDIILTRYYELQEKHKKSSRAAEFISAVDFINGPGTTQTTEVYGKKTNSHTTICTRHNATWAVTLDETFDATAEDHVTYTLTANLENFVLPNPNPLTQDTVKEIAQDVAFAAIYRILSSVEYANSIIEVQNLDKLPENLREQVLIYCEIMCNLYGAEFNLDDITQEHEQQQIREKAAEKKNIKDFVNFIEKNYEVAQLAPLFKEVRDFYDQLTEVEQSSEKSCNRADDIKDIYIDIKHLFGEKRQEDIKQRLQKLTEPTEKYNESFETIELEQLELNDARNDEQQQNQSYDDYYGVNNSNNVSNSMIEITLTQQQTVPSNSELDVLLSEIERAGDINTPLSLEAMNLKETIFASQRTVNASRDVINRANEIILLKYFNCRLENFSASPQLFKAYDQEITKNASAAGLLDHLAKHAHNVKVLAANEWTTMQANINRLDQSTIEHDPAIQHAATDDNKLPQYACNNLKQHALDAINNLIKYDDLSYQVLEIKAKAEDDLSDLTLKINPTQDLEYLQYLVINCYLHGIDFKISEPLLQYHNFATTDALLQSIAQQDAYGYSIYKEYRHWLKEYAQPVEMRYLLTPGERRAISEQCFELYVAGEHDYKDGVLTIKLECAKEWQKITTLTTTINRLIDETKEALSHNDPCAANHYCKLAQKTLEFLENSLATPSLNQDQARKKQAQETVSAINDQLKNKIPPKKSQEFKITTVEGNPNYATSLHSDKIITMVQQYCYYSFDTLFEQTSTKLLTIENDIANDWSRAQKLNLNELESMYSNQEFNLKYARWQKEIDELSKKINFSYEDTTKLIQYQLNTNTLDQRFDNIKQPLITLYNNVSKKLERLHQNYKAIKSLVDDYRTEIGYQWSFRFIQESVQFIIELLSKNFTNYWALVENEAKTKKEIEEFLQKVDRKRWINKDLVQQLFEQNKIISQLIPTKIQETATNHLPTDPNHPNHPDNNEIFATLMTELSDANANYLEQRDQLTRQAIFDIIWAVFQIIDQHHSSNNSKPIDPDAEEGKNITEQTKSLEYIKDNESIADTLVELIEAFLNASLNNELLDKLCAIKDQFNIAEICNLDPNDLEQVFSEILLQNKPVYTHSK